MRGAAVAACAALPFMAACVASHRVSTTPSTVGAVGVYRATATGSGRPVRFKVLLSAARPDRLRIEVVPPLGGPAWIVDAGADRIVALDVGGRVAWTGSAGADSVERVLGVPVGLATLVEEILSGGADLAPVVASRRPASEPGLPEELSFEHDGRVLRLERLDVRPGTPLTAVPPDPPAAFARKLLGDLGTEEGPFSGDGEPGP